ncbi:MAG: CPBP family intramembrane glutamic endopeptidase [Planctomycetota bacterium]
MSVDESEPADEQTPDEVFLTAVLFECGLAVVALILGWAIGPSARQLVPELELEQWRPIVQGVLWGIVAAIPILILISLLVRIPWKPIQELDALTNDGMIKTLLQLRPSELIVVSLCAGIGEELLFRGWLMYWLEGIASSISPNVNEAWAIGSALVISSVVFGVFHPVTKLYIVLATIIGLYFGALVIYTENLLIPIVAHATYDAVHLIMTSREERHVDSKSC